MPSSILLPLDVPEMVFGVSGEGQIRRSVLPSGIRILSERVPGARSVTIGYWVAVGSRDEISAEDGGNGAHAGSLGSTHFLEHLLFKGTPTRTAFDIAEAFDGVGGEHNAVTAKEYTCYYAKIRDRDLEMAISVMSDMITSSVIDAQEFETERGVILEELAMAEDDPSDVAHERLFETVLGAHPLGRPIGGNPETIRAADRDAVVEHYRANYRPNDIVISAAGSLDHDQLVAWVVRDLEAAGWDLGLHATPVARRPRTTSTVTRSQALITIDRPIEQANIAIGMPGITMTDARRPVMSTLNAILGGGMASRLFQEVREKRGLAYTVYSFASGYSDAGVFGMFAGASPKNAAEVVRVMLAELESIASNGVTQAEMQRVKGQLAGSTALALEDTDTRMSRLGRAEIGHGEFYDYDTSISILEAVTAEQVQDLAAVLASEEISIVSVGKADADKLQKIVEERTS
jgi:predicted Zn-dependent peptidase